MRELAFYANLRSSASSDQWTNLKVTLAIAWVGRHVGKLTQVYFLYNIFWGGKMNKQMTSDMQFRRKSNGYAGEKTTFKKRKNSEISVVNSLEMKSKFR